MAHWRRSGNGALAPHLQATVCLCILLPPLFAGSTQRIRELAPGSTKTADTRPAAPRSHRFRQAPYRMPMKRQR